MVFEKAIPTSPESTSRGETEMRRRRRRFVHPFCKTYRPLRPVRLVQRKKKRRRKAIQAFRRRKAARLRGDPERNRDDTD
jgi:hypothetical protein